MIPVSLGPRNDSRHPRNHYDIEEVKVTLATENISTTAVEHLDGKYTSQALSLLSTFSTYWALTDV